MQSPHTLIGLGDGGAHVGIISDGSFPTTLLAHWGRDRAQGRLDVSWLVKRQTQDNARAVGLNDRGVIAPGYKADLNVIDFDKLGVEAPVMKWDLPAGGKRLLQKATRLSRHHRGRRRDLSRRRGDRRAAGQAGAGAATGGLIPASDLSSLLLVTGAGEGGGGVRSDAIMICDLPALDGAPPPSLPV